MDSRTSGLTPRPPAWRRPRVLWGAFAALACVTSLALVSANARRESVRLDRLFAQAAEAPGEPGVSPPPRSSKPKQRASARPASKVPPKTDQGLQPTFYRPSGEAPYHSQVQIGFNHPLIPLTSVTDPERQKVLSRFSLVPAPSGNFKFVGTSAVVFEPTKPFPPATKYTFSVSSQLKDTQGRLLGHEFRKTFWTKPVSLWMEIMGLGREYEEPDELTKRKDPLRPTIRISSNAALKLSSLQRHLVLRIVTSGKPRPLKLPVTITSNRGNPPAIQDLAEGRRGYSYIVALRERLQRHNQYQVAVTAGLEPEVGNMPTQKEFAQPFSTYGPLTFGVISSECGPALMSEFNISSSNPLVPATTKGAARISPKVGNESVLKDLDLPQRLLKPRTTYTVTISTQVRDIFGQRLDHPAKLTFTTPDLKPDIRVLQGMNLITTATEPVVPYRVANPGKVKTEVFGLSEVELLSNAFHPTNRSFEDFIDRLSSSAKRSIDAYALNANVVRDLSLSPFLGEKSLGMAFYHLATSNRECGHGPPVHRYGALLRTNLGLRVQLLPAGLHVWATHLTDGSPASSAKVRIYLYPGAEGESSSKRAPTPLFSGALNSDGQLTVGARELKNRDSYLGDSRGFFVVVREGSDYSFVSSSGLLHNTLDLWRFGLSDGWDGPQLVSLGNLFSDRYFYLEGETVTMKGVVRYRTEDRILTPTNLTFKVSVDPPDGESRTLGTVTTDDFGGFSLTIPTQQGDPLGYYTVTARSKDPSLSVSGQYRVADFQPPRYKTSLKTDKNLYLVGDDIVATATGAYLFGAPLAGGSATFLATASQASFAPPGWEEFSFSFPDWIEEEMDHRETADKSLLRQTVELNDKGQKTLHLPVTANDVPRPMRYSVGVDVKDVSGQSVGDSRQVTALPFAKLIGVKVVDSFIPARKFTTAGVVVTDPDGKPLSGIALRVDLQSIKWVYKTVKEEGETYDRYVPVLKNVSSQQIVSGSVPVTVTVTPPKPGDYLVQSRFEGRQPTGTEGAGWLYAYGREETWERQQDLREDMELQLKLDRQSYKVGDIVSVAVPSPFEKALALVTVEREKIFSQRRTEVAKGVTPVTFQITKEMIPNVFVEVALVEQGPSNGNLFEKYEHRPYRVGIHEVPVSRDPHRLQVDVKPLSKAVRPRGTAGADFHVSDASGSPATVQLTVMVVDEAILQLSGHRPPDLVESVFQDRSLSLCLMDNRPFVIHAGKKIPMHKGYGYGDGGSTEGQALFGDVRKDFRRLAYFNGSLRTDAQGNAHCEFQVPENLTTWRIMAVAVSRENDFGSGDDTFVVNQPLLLEGLLPRFARVGDSISVGVAVNNQTGRDGQATVSYEVVEGGSHLLPFPSQSRQQVISLSAGRTVAARWKHKVVGLGECVLRFTCSLPGKDTSGSAVTATDGLELRFNAQEPGQVQTVAVADEVENQRSIDVKVTPEMRTDLGELAITLSSTAYGNLTADANYLLKYPYGCVEQISSRTLGFLALEDPVRKFHLKLETQEPLKQIIETNLRTIGLAQNSNGGFGYWRGDGPVYYLSVYVAEILSTARSHGYVVPKRTIDRLVEYLRKTPPDSVDEPSRTHFLVLRSYALQALGAPDTTYYAEMLSKKEGLPLHDWVRLATVFYASPDWRKKAEDLFREIKKREWITARSAHLEEWPQQYSRWRFFDSSVALAAMGLRLDLKMQPKDPRVSRTANYLVQCRLRKGWRDTYDTALILDTLDGYLRVREAQEPDFTAGIELDGRETASLKFAGYELGQQFHRIPMRQLGQGAHTLVLAKRGKGALYSTVELNYYPSIKQPPLSEGFWIERAMTNLRTHKDVSSTGEIRVGDVVRVKLTLNAPQNGNHVVVEAPVPAGMLPVDTSFKTTPLWQGEEETSSRIDYRWNPFDHTEQHKDHVALFAQSFDAGIYVYEFLVQAVNPGEFLYPPARIYRMYEPEEFGATERGTVTIGS